MNASVEKKQMCVSAPNIVTLAQCKFGHLYICRFKCPPHQQPCDGSSDVCLAAYVWSYASKRKGRDFRRRRCGWSVCRSQLPLSRISLPTSGGCQNFWPRRRPERGALRISVSEFRFQSCPRAVTPSVSAPAERLPIQERFKSKKQANGLRMDL